MSEKMNVFAAPGQLYEDTKIDPLAAPGELFKENNDANIDHDTDAEITSAPGQEVPQSNLVEDKDKARFMAERGDPYRRVAADARRVGKLIVDEVVVNGRNPDDLVEEATEDWKLNHRGLDKDLASHRKRISDSAGHMTDSRLARDMIAMKGGPEGAVDRLVQTVNETEATADIAEEAAGQNYDHFKQEDEKSQDMLARLGVKTEKSE